MKTITQKYESRFREQGSKFMGYLFPAETQEDFEHELEGIKSAYPNATHHCYAWRLNPAQPKEYSSDDGEPPGTAGLPILNHLKSYEVVNAGVVVIRYYGGTKLGKSGLIEAYGRAADLCLAEARLKTIDPVRMMDISYPYSEENTINKIQNDFDLTVTKSKYMENVTLTVACPLSKANELEQYLEGLAHTDISFTKKGEYYI